MNANATVLMMRGNFYIQTADQLVRQIEQPGLSYESLPHNLQEGMAIIISQTSMISLLESFLEHQQYQTTKALQSTIKMAVEDLEDLFEGFSTAFDESEDIEIVTTLLKTNNITIDDTFNNIAFRLNLRHEFKNPIQPKYLAAQVTTSIQGVLSLEMNERMEIKFNSDIK